MSKNPVSGTNEVGSPSTSCEDDPCAEDRKKFKIRGGIANYGYWCGHRIPCLQSEIRTGCGDKSPAA